MHGDSYVGRTVIRYFGQYKALGPYALEDELVILPAGQNKCRAETALRCWLTSRTGTDRSRLNKYGPSPRLSGQ